MNKNVIIVAGGKGLRMQTEIPKQFIKIGDMPILMHTISAFYNYDNNINIILALPKDNIKYWDSLCKEYNFSIKHKIVEGGKTRFNSVENALKIITEGIVAIHDAVRPFISYNLIQNCFNTAKDFGNAIPCTEITHSIREVISEEKNRTIDRSKLRAIQTPQTFKVEVIKNAFSKANHNNFTDDASVLEAIGRQINLIEGEQTNIKITSQQDLLFANFILTQNK